MPYNTRRKSLSLPALGIQLPNSSRAHRPSISKTNEDGESHHMVPRAKRVKRSHSSESTELPATPMSTTSPATSTTSKTVTFADRPKSNGRSAYEHTPPPSPGASNERKIDFDGINDDIVTGVLEQLEKTGNRPHLIKELATVLSTTNDSVAGYNRLSSEDRIKLTTAMNRSANPAALLSSRLATYMKRPWTALAPCPVAKELIPVHPRKVFYYLTTTPRQELPNTSDDILPSHGGKTGGKRIISPSLSNASQEDEDDYGEERKRAALSPSPEIDLTLDLDDSTMTNASNAEPDFPTPGSSLHSGHGSMDRSGSVSERDFGLNHRSEPPQLEVEEREFTHTAQNISMRSMSTDESANEINKKLEPDSEALESEEQRAQRNSEAAAALFGSNTHQEHSKGESDNSMVLSSPVLRGEHNPPTVQHGDFVTKHTVTIKTEDMAHMDIEMASPSILGDAGFTWDIVKPENVCLDELDNLFDDF